MEPDNPGLHPFALHNRKLPGRFYPALDRTYEAPAYERLWQEAFRQPPRTDTALDALRRQAARKLLRRGREDIQPAFTTTPRFPLVLRAAEALAVPVVASPARHVVVKSVYAARALEWIAERVDARAVIVQRDVRSIVSSWLYMWGLDVAADEIEIADPVALHQWANRAGIPPQPEEPLERSAWFFAVLQRLMAETAERHPDWIEVGYEDLCADPVMRFRSLSAELGLPWGSREDELVRSSNRPGTGYETFRVAAEARDVWRARLTPEQEQQVSAVVTAVATAG
jgi:hypothetical protein